MSRQIEYMYRHYSPLEREGFVRKANPGVRFDRLWHDAQLLTLAAPHAWAIGRSKGAVGCRDGRITFVGAMEALPSDATAGEYIDCQGRWITPGLIDCHTHLVYGGNRAGEFEVRLAGAGYEEIARTGGGIVSTMHATRAASETELIRQSLPRLDALLSEGVTTVEIKSGYGLTLADERKQLRVARSLAEHRKVRVATTFLGAHALPPEYSNDSDGYIECICRDMLPEIAREGLADAVDAFCEGIGFSAAQVERVFCAARALGLPVKLHAEQLSNLHGAALAADHDALSADHLEHIDETGITAMARAGTVAVLLPGAYYFTRETRLPPIAAFRAAGVPMALATDCNPGTSPLTSPLLAMNMAATLFRMKVEECLAGMTREAARALGLGDQTGTLEVGKACDLAIWDIGEPAELVYGMGHKPLHARIFGGKSV